MRLKFSRPELFKTALEIFRGRALTTHALAARIGMYRYDFARALRPKSTDSHIVDTTEILAS